MEPIKTTVGSCFVNVNKNEICRGIFCENLPESTITIPLIKQYVMDGVFTSDLETLSRLFGRQGTATKYGYMFSLIVKRQVQLSFINLDQQMIVDPRTLDMLREDGKQYNTMMSVCVNEKAQTKCRGDITRDSTYSIIIEPIAGIDPMCDGTPILMHISLGKRVGIVKVKRNVFQKR